jgi:isoleucyl-tRNA synthetase
VTFFNISAFYSMFNKGAEVSPPVFRETKNILDKWALSKLNQATKDATEALEKYDIVFAARRIAGLIDDLSVWYLRRSRERFRNGGEDATTVERNLSWIRYVVCRLLAPFVPFAAEAVFTDVKKGGGVFRESVHLEEWPEFDENFIDLKLMEDMEETRKTVSLVLNERVKKGIKVKQPLSLVKIKSLSSRVAQNEELVNLIKDEVNIKDIAFDKNLEEEVWLDTEITPELKREGLYREYLRVFQEERKQSGLMPGDFAVCDLSLNISREVGDEFYALLKKNAGLIEIRYDSDFKKGREVYAGGEKFYVKIGLEKK